MLGMHGSARCCRPLTRRFAPSPLCPFVLVWALLSNFTSIGGQAEKILADARSRLGSGWELKVRPSALSARPWRIMRGEYASPVKLSILCALTDLHRPAALPQLHSIVWSNAPRLAVTSADVAAGCHVVVLRHLCRIGNVRVSLAPGVYLLEGESRCDAIIFCRC